MKSYKFLIVGAFSFLSLFSCGENKTNPFCYKIGNGELFKVLNLTDVQLDYAGQLKDDITIKPTIDKMIKNSNQQSLLYLVIMDGKQKEWKEKKYYNVLVKYASV